MDDGHAWRKYGQKKIANTKYYRYIFISLHLHIHMRKKISQHYENWYIIFYFLEKKNIMYQFL